jgi:3'-phosphoadenosine 5'-phosphosulfate sulfotransferase (PAPS reductase)/FAD synthetase
VKDLDHQTHYKLPDGNVQIQFSGGRTSGLMLCRILDANGGLPDRAEVVFQNTGREMEETLDFVQECSEQWGVPITWLEYQSEAPKFRVVTHKTASRNGEPFADLIRKKKFLPTRVARFCTAELKIYSASRYARSRGWQRWTSCLGIRADEPRRLEAAPPKEPWWVQWYPLAAAGVTKRDVKDFWSRQAFDLRLAGINGRTPHGNCDGCFLKSEATRAALARDYPERFAWWVEQERISNGTFRKDGSYAALGDFSRRQADWIFDTEGALCQADDGECT